MEVKEVMSRDVLTAAPQQTLREAAEMMQRIDSGFIPVAEDDRLVGVVTDRDIVINGIAQGASADTEISKVMSEGAVLYCFEDEEVAAVARNMGEYQVRRLPVVNSEKRLTGIVSLGDLSCDGDPSAAGVALENISEPS